MKIAPSTAATELLPAIAGDGWRILAVTNCRKMKPHPAVYEMARREARGEIWMVAAHAWDIPGAIRAGFRAVFVSGLEQGYLDVYPKPDLIVAELGAVRTALTRAGALR